MLDGGEYRTEITFEELKGHYEMHFLSASLFMELVNEWHNSEIKKAQTKINKQFETVNGEVRCKCGRIAVKFRSGYLCSGITVPHGCSYKD